MTITKLKAKNQLTIPSTIITRLGLRPNEIFSVDVEKNYIRLIPVTVEPRYAPQELETIDRMVAHEQKTGKVIKPGKEFSKYLKGLAKA